MKHKPAGRPASSERIIRDIKRKTRKQYSKGKGGLASFIAIQLPVRVIWFTLY